MWTRRRFFEAGLGLGAAATAARLPGASHPSLPPDQCHAALMHGNQRFLSGHPRHPHSSLAYAKRVGRDGQHPHTIVLTCSDSRLAPEIIFDQGIGDLFVVRVAGNVANSDEIGSIEYAAEHLGATLCLVLGHTGCGAVSAVVSGGPLPSEIEHLVVPIQRAFAHVKSQHPEASEKELVSATVRANVIESCTGLTHSPKLLEEAIHAGHLRIEGAVYDLDTGRVQWVFPGDKAAPETHR